MSTPRTDIGSAISVLLGCASDVVATGAPKLVVAGGASDDATERQGYTIDRYVSGSLAKSAKIVTVVLANVADGETLALAHEYEDSADASTFNTAVAIEASTTKITGATATGVTGLTVADEHELDLSSLERYFRINVTPDFSAGSTDTCLFATVVVLGGFDLTPVS